MASTIGYTTHSDDTTTVFNVVLYCKPEKAHITFLRKEHAVRIQAPRPGKEFMRTDGKIYLPKNIDTDRPMQVSTKDSLLITFHKKVPTAYTVADLTQPVAAS